jgi:Na+-translocating ferredoxin:NAD+ oxidoreductase RnfC subunit
MKPNKDYRMSKTTKCILALMKDQSKASMWKKSSIEAELCEKAAKNSKLKDRNANQGDE